MPAASHYPNYTIPAPQRYQRSNLNSNPVITYRLRKTMQYLRKVNCSGSNSKQGRGAFTPKNANKMSVKIV
jgi:hypothetical protein